MKRALKVIGLVTLVVVLLAGIWVTDNLIYPFKSESPNYSDVEKAFAKLQFPSEWQEISSSENRGLHGRGCNPLNDAGCFHKNTIFKVDDTNAKEIVKSMFLESGCEGVSEKPYTNNPTDDPSYNLFCTIGNNVNYSANISGVEPKVSVTASTN